MKIHVNYVPLMAQYVVLVAGTTDPMVKVSNM